MRAAVVLVGLCFAMGPRASGGGIRLDATAQPGLQASGPTAPIAAAVADFDRDGFPDLALAGEAEGVRLFRGGVSGVFSNATDRLPDPHTIRALGVSWVDGNNDGYPDLFATGWGTGSRFYWNQGDGTFRAGAGDDLSANVLGMTTAWTSLSSDPWPDAVMAVGGGASSDPQGLFLGSVEGDFQAPANNAVAGSSLYGSAACWGDADGDSRPDLVIVGGWDGPNLFFRNVGAGVLEPVVPSPMARAGARGGGAGCAWADFDNDGDADLYIAAGGGGDQLWVNQGGGTFRSHAGLGSLGLTGATVGVVWADFDNDGWLDLLVANRTGSPHLLRNLQNGQFARETEAEIARQPGSSNGLAVGDLNGDGALDVVTANWPGGGAVVYRNAGTTNGWLRVPLEGSASNRSGLGAVVRVTARLGGRAMTQSRWIGGEDGWGTQEAVAHFGLGDAGTVDTLEVRWPSGAVSTLTGVSASRQVVVAESGEHPVVLPASGRYFGLVRVTIVARQEGGRGVRYTLDGSEPGLESASYSGPFEVLPPITVRARVFQDGRPISGITDVEYLRDPGLVLEPPAMLFTNQIRVRMTAVVAGAEIRYTTDGSEPVSTSPRFNSELRIDSTLTLKARAFLNGFPVSDTVSASYRRQYVFPPDGIADEWRIRHFGVDFLSDPRAALGEDPDGDGSNNLQEFTSGTNPLDATSGFAVGIRAVPEIRFHSVAGVSYRIVRRSAWGGDPVVVVERLAGVGGPMRYVDASIADSAGVYVVEPIP